MCKENCMPSTSSDGWRPFVPNGQEGVSFSSEEGVLSIVTAREHFALGKWTCRVDVTGGEVLDFSVDCKTSLGEEDVYVLLTQYTKEGKMPIREHAHGAKREGEVIHFFEKIELDPETVSLEVELWVKGKGVFASYLSPTLVASTPYPARPVRIAPIHIKRPGASKEEQKKNILLAIDKAGELGADIIILGEGVYGRGLGLSLTELAKTDESEMRGAVGARAKQHRAYIVYNTVEREGELYYNTSFLFARDGTVVGKYRKTHLPVVEYEAGFAPGEDFPVFDLDFGKVGLLICYDQFFPRTAEILAMRGAELICIPSAGDMHSACLSRAIENGVYIAVAGMNNENPYGWGATRVVDPLGNILAHTDGDFAVALAEVDLSRRVRRRWMSTGPAKSDVHDDYRFEKNPHCFDET